MLFGKRSKEPENFYENLTSDKSEYGFVLIGIKLKRLDFELPEE